MFGAAQGGFPGCGKALEEDLLFCLEKREPTGSEVWVAASPGNGLFPWHSSEWGWSCCLTLLHPLLPLPSRVAHRDHSFLIHSLSLGGCLLVDFVCLCPFPGGSCGESEPCDTVWGCHRVGVTMWVSPCGCHHVGVTLWVV